MTLGSLFFAFCGLVSVVGALATVLAKSPIRSAVGLLSTIIGIAGLFLLLSAQFLAAIQLIVSAGAVVVLFVFVIMLLGPDARGQTATPSRSTVSRILGSTLGGLTAIGAMVAAAVASEGLQQFGSVKPDHGTARAVGTLLFTDGLVAFEVTTALLIVAVVGAIALARSRTVARPASGSPPGEPRRLFSGPIDDPSRPRPELKGPELKGPELEGPELEEATR